MRAVEYEIPPSVLKWLERVPRDASVAMLLRHSVRPPLPPDNVGFNTAITEEGERLAFQLGELLGARLRSLHSSPLDRCVQTAEALGRGARSDLVVNHSHLLGHPGVFVVDGQAAARHWNVGNHERILDHLQLDDDPLSGLAAGGPAARFLVHSMLAQGAGTPGVHVFVTHDSLVTATAGRMLRRRIGRDEYPWFLEAAFFWRTKDAVWTGYRDHSSAWAEGPLCALNDSDVIELARREVTAMVGSDCPARFFLAGGAFKSLLTGRAPRDLDLWAASPSDRELLIDALLKRGAVRTGATQFADVFELWGRTIDVPFKTEPGEIEGRLARFDLALSAIGVEHRPGSTWRAAIHPLAVESATRREVLLLRPLVNWRHALSTLVRLRRYAVELGYGVPQTEVDEIWQTFEAQPRSVKEGMLERLALSSEEVAEVRAEANRRLA